MVAKLLLVACIQAVILQSIAAQGYGTIPGIVTSGCGCGSSISIPVSNCGCSNAVPALSISNCGCSNSVPALSVSNCGCSNSVPALSVSNCGCSNSVPAISVPSSACSSSNYGFSKTTTASTGGPLSVTCYGPLSTNGVSVLAELGIQGDVAVTGSLPFLSAVVLEGTLPTSGMAAVNYGCGDGNIVILQESGNPSGNNAASNSGLSLASVGAGACGCRY